MKTWTPQEGVYGAINGGVNAWLNRIHSSHGALLLDLTWKNLEGGRGLTHGSKSSETLSTVHANYLGDSRRTTGTENSEQAPGMAAEGRFVRSHTL